MLQKLSLYTPFGMHTFLIFLYPVVVELTDNLPIVLESSLVRISPLLKTMPSDSLFEILHLNIVYIIIICIILFPLQTHSLWEYGYLRSEC
jgi:hypothetical protein